LPQEATRADSKEKEKEGEHEHEHEHEHEPKQLGTSTTDSSKPTKEGEYHFVATAQDSDETGDLGTHPHTTSSQASTSSTPSTTAAPGESEGELR